MPVRGGALPGTDPDLVTCDFGTGLFDCECFMAPDETLGIVDKDGRALAVGRGCEDDLAPDTLSVALPLAGKGCDAASVRDQDSWVP